MLHQWRFFVATVLRMAPGTFVLVWFGGASSARASTRLLGGLAALVVIAYIYYRRNLRSGRS